MDNKREFLLRLPKYLHDIMTRYKEQTSIPITAQIIDCIYRQMIIRGFITISDIRNGIDLPKEELKSQEIKSQAMPEELKFCDGDTCEIDPLDQKSC